MDKVYFCIFLTYFLNVYDALETNTLTTATILQDTSPKPKTFMRRFNLKTGEISDSSDLHKESDAKSKETTSVWTWDSWCQLQAKEGKCRRQIKRFYYNIQLKECSPFYFGGCDGNKNNFKTIFECERRCKGSGFKALDKSLQPDYCHLQPDSGFCLAIVDMYYYDVNDRTCKKFVYGGCGGNHNKFRTKYSCLKACGDRKI